MRIFTVQDEPPDWDEDDDADLESVSEPDIENPAEEDSDLAEDADLLPPTSHPSIPPPVDIETPFRNLGQEDDDWEAADRSISLPERGSTPSSQPVLVERPSMDMPSKAIPLPGPPGDVRRAQLDGMREDVGQGRPPSVAPSGGRTRTESWVKPVNEGEAPNGDSVI